SPTASIPVYERARGPPSLWTHVRAVGPRGQNQPDQAAESRGQSNCRTTRPDRRRSPCPVDVRRSTSGTLRETGLGSSTSRRRWRAAEQRGGTRRSSFARSSYWAARCHARRNSRCHASPCVASGALRRTCAVLPITTVAPATWPETGRSSRRDNGPDVDRARCLACSTSRSNQGTDSRARTAPQVRTVGRGAAPSHFGQRPRAHRSRVRGDRWRRYSAVKSFVLAVSNLEEIQAPRTGHVVKTTPIPYGRIQAGRRLVQPSFGHEDQP